MVQKVASKHVRVKYAEAAVNLEALVEAELEERMLRKRRVCEDGGRCRCARR